MAFLEVRWNARASIGRVLAIQPMGAFHWIQASAKKAPRITPDETILSPVVGSQHERMVLVCGLPHTRCVVIMVVREEIDLSCVDTPITEKMDYFSAALAILNALYYTVIRLLHLYQPSRPRLTATPSQSTLPKLLTLVFVGTYAAHIYYLTSGPRFDYTYNTIFNLILGLLHNLLWTFYALPSTLSLLPSRYPNRPRGYRPSFATKAGLFVALTTAATALELFDFPPWARVLDAHALWHAATAPIAFFWYQFLIEDSLDQSWREPLLREHLK
ncbi:hypothetical protein NMY22_g14760 [Coprinellus aureogranulatus]|nr:hypothetical protein NMY22_g14760 [Coprinellus aureogranulatus]